MSWIERVSENVLPLSESEDIAEALREWAYSGQCYDLETATGVCQLCGHPGIRYEFVIHNDRTANELGIGSECITRFGIRAADEAGNMLGGAETQERVSQDRNRLITEARRRRLINALVQLAATEDEFDLGDWTEYFDRRNAFTPSQLAYIFWRLDHHHISHNKGDFKLTIRRNREKEQLRQMPSWKVQRLWPAMSRHQRAWYEAE